MEEENKYFCRADRNKGCRVYLGKIVTFPLCEFCDYSDKIEDECIPDNTKIYSGRYPLGETLERISKNQ